MPTNLISDEDWAIISSSSDYDDESTASSLIDPVGENSSSELTPESVDHSTGNAPDNANLVPLTTESTDSGTVNGNDPATDSVCTIREVEFESALSEQTYESLPNATQTGQIKPRSGVDARIRGWSQHLFAALFARFKLNLDATKAQNVQTVSLTKHAMFSLFSTLERNQELLLYYFALLLSAAVFGFQYAPAVFVMLRDFARTRVLPGLRCKSRLVLQSRLELFKASALAWTSRLAKTEKLPAGFSNVSVRTSGIASDVRIKVLKGIKKLRLEFTPVQYHLKQWIVASTNRLGTSAGRYVDGFGAYSREASGYLSGAHKSLATYAASFCKWALAAQLFSKVSGTRLKVAGEKVNGMFAKLLNNLASCVNWTLIHSKGLLRDSRCRFHDLMVLGRDYFAGLKPPVTRVAEDLQQWTLAIGTLGSSYFHLSKQFFLNCFSKDALVTSYERYCSFSSRYAQRLAKSKEAFDSVSRKMYHYVWADNIVLLQWRKFLA